MTRAASIDEAHAYFDSKAFHADLARRVAIPTESQNPDRAGELNAYLESELTPSLETLGFVCCIYPNPKKGGPFLIATRTEGADLPTVMSYGHGDVVRGLDAQWRSGLEPWKLIEEGEKLFGRGTADNKGQHSINIGALASVIRSRSPRCSNGTGTPAEVTLVTVIPLPSASEARSSQKLDVPRCTNRTVTVAVPSIWSVLSFRAS